MKKYLSFLFITTFCFTLNNSAGAYNKKDLENLQLYSAIAELALAVPFLVDRDNRLELIALSAPAVILERLSCCALETNTDFISDFALLLQRLHISKSEMHLKIFVMHLIQSIVLRITRNFIKDIYPRDQERINRRFVRTIACSIITAVLDNDSLTEQNWIERFLNMLILLTIGEYIGEKIIQGTDEEYLKLNKSMIVPHSS